MNRTFILRRFVFTLLGAAPALALLWLAPGCATAPQPGAGAGAPPTAAAAPAPEPVPDHFAIDFETSVGPVFVAVDRADSPHGAERLFRLVQAHYFDQARFFRVVPGFVVQFGLAADPKVSKAWDKPILDDPVKRSNTRGTLVFAATSEPNSRTTQIFINLASNGRLDSLGFAPVGRVISGMENVDRIYDGDREGPDQEKIEAKGNAYLTEEFPKLDFVKTATIVPQPAAPTGPAPAN